MRLGYRTLLRDYPRAIVRIRCRKCDLCDDYRLFELVEHFGFEIDCLNALKRLIDCPRWTADGSIWDDAFCGATMPELCSSEPPPRPRPTGRPMLRVVK